ncbi:MAG: type II secretion protein F, partial [Thermoplasmata archaeon]
MEFLNLFKKKLPEKEEGKIYKVALPKGTGPSYSTLNTLQRIAFKIFGKFVSKNKNIAKLGDDLLKAHMMIRPQEYISYVYFLTLISAIVLLSFFIFTIFIGNIIIELIGLIALIIVPTIVYILMMGNPSSLAKTRGKKIDGKLPATMNFISALASADVNVDMIFKELARRP